MTDFWNDKIVPFFNNVGTKLTDFWSAKAMPFFKDVAAKLVTFWSDKAEPFFKEVGAKLATFWLEKALPFLQTGNNKYYVIAGGVALVAIIIIASAFGVKSSKDKKAAKNMAKYSRPIDEPVVEVKNAHTVETPVADAGIMHPSVFNIKNAEMNSGVATSHPIPTAVNADEAEKKSVEVAAAVDEESAEEEKSAPKGKILIYKDAGSKFRFRMIAVNGNIVAHSQGYIAKASCKNGIEAVKKLCSAGTPTVDTTKPGSGVFKPTIGDAVFEVYRDSENKYRFRLRSPNTQIILASQGYTNKANCISGIKSVKAVAENSEFVDTTVA